MGRSMSKLVILLIILICQPALAQTGFAKSPSSQALSAEDFFKFFAQYEKFSSLKTAFIQKKIMPGLDITLEAEGTLTVKRPDTVIWEITKPGEMKVQLNKTTLSIISGKGKNQEVENWSLDKLPSKISEKLFIMNLWLNFDPKGLYQQYEVFEIKPYQFKFIPKRDIDTGFSSLEMHLHKNGYIKKLIIQEESGDILDYTFNRPQFSRLKSK